MRLHWSYIFLPVAFLAIALILAACIFPMLPDQVAYHFQNDTPDRWLSRGAFIAWMLIPQFIFTLIAFVIVQLVGLTSRHLPSGGSPLHDVLQIMGNMMALPQIVFIFAMIDFFLYNAYQIKLIPLWVFILIILVLGAIALVILFIRATRRAHRRQAIINQEKSHAGK